MRRIAKKNVSTAINRLCIIKNKVKGFEGCEVLKGVISSKSEDIAIKIKRVRTIFVVELIRDFLLHDVIEGQMTTERNRRRRQLLDLRKTEEYWELKAKAENRKRWKLHY